MLQEGTHRRRFDSMRKQVLFLKLGGRSVGEASIIP